MIAKTTASLSRQETRLPRVAALALAASILAVPALADSYDGTWQVTIVTEQGSCAKAFSYPLAVRDGQVSNTGYLSAKTAGQVEGSGAVRVNISFGDKSAQGTGKLSSDSGAGTWKGSDCSGRWKAARKA
jgi:hypothetical protein